MGSVWSSPPAAITSEETTQRETKAVSVPHYKAEEADGRVCDEAEVGTHKNIDQT